MSGQWAPWEAGKGCRRLLTGNAGAEEPVRGQAHQLGSSSRDFSMGLELGLHTAPEISGGQAGFFSCCQSRPGQETLG